MAALIPAFVPRFNQRGSISGIQTIRFNRTA